MPRHRLNTYLSLNLRFKVRFDKAAVQSVTHNSCDRQYINPPRTSPFEQFGNLVHRRTGGDHIIDQQHMGILNTVGIRHGKGTAHIHMTRGRLIRSLGRRRPVAGHQLRFEYQFRQVGAVAAAHLTDQIPGQFRRLIVPPEQQASPMQRHRHHQQLSIRIKLRQPAH